MSQQIHTVSAVVVCFHPDPGTLRQLVLQLLPDVRHVWLVNNGEPSELPNDLGPQVHAIELGRNLGVAAALNAGFERAYAAGADAVKLQTYREGGLRDAIVFNEADGATWIDPAGRTRTEADLAEWQGPRAGAGKMAPRGFPRDNKFT